MGRLSQHLEHDVTFESSAQRKRDFGSSSLCHALWRNEGESYVRWILRTARDLKIRLGMCAVAYPVTSVAMFALFAPAAPAHGNDAARWRSEVQNTTIVRDGWGIAHVHGNTDADAVFGMIYAQAEDDFNRVEMNYLTALGRLAEAEGKNALFADLRMRLFVSADELKVWYAASPQWLRKLMVAWADGLNCYLKSHPRTRPRVLHRFEPWMALSFSEGSIGGDIERVPLAPLQELYGAHIGGAVAAALPEQSPEPKGSNGFAIGPSNTKSGHALLLINPHTSFFFRSELQATSNEGLNVYGAATWGQFFIYQGFNERVGWMHTSSGVDAVDFFAETIVKERGQLFYRYGAELRPLARSTLSIAYRKPRGGFASRTFTVYRTHHGPIIYARDGKWVSIALMQKPVEALSQSFLLTKARDYASFMKVMQLRANSTNNTIFADADGDIAYLHPQFIPRRDDHFDYTEVVDGADPATDWQGLHALGEAPHLLNPPNGWLMNTNNWPYSAAGANSPKREDYPRYMDTVGETPRGLHAILVLQDKSDFTIASLNAAAYDPYLTAFARLIPTLVKAFDARPAAGFMKNKLTGQIEILRSWNYRWSLDSVATTLACLWGDELWSQVEKDAKNAKVSAYDYIANHTGDSQKLDALAAVSDRLEHDYGTWRVPWGEINRFQRLTGDIARTFTDAGPSVPIAFTSARWGSLASFGARRYEGTTKYYGSTGNSFVAVVEFGDKVSARAVSTGGESGDPNSTHFDDQTARYADGNLREVYFYPAQLAGHSEREYHPQ
jgi:acyl-homoserine-lactone acylase